MGRQMKGGVKRCFPMKYLILLCFVMGMAHAQEIETQNIDVGSPRDCVVVGSEDDQGDDVDRNQLQQMITDCLGPQEEEAKTQVETKHHEVVSQ